MTTSTGRLSERLMVGASATLVVGVAIAADETVRHRLLGLVNGGAADDLAGVTVQFSHAVRVVNEAIPFDGTAHGMVAMFVIAAVVILAMMLKV